MMSVSTSRSRPDWPWLLFAALLCTQLWAAHAAAFFLHEYAHSFVAWAAGWKANPFALNYAHPTLKVFLMQMGINQNVDEGSIFASGHGPTAAIIAGAGMIVGNGLLSYPLSRLGYSVARKHDQRNWGLFSYWCTVASIGNFIDYVPVRTFTLEGDMGSIQRGFGWSPWTVIVVLGIPIAAAMTYFFLKIEPASLTWLFPNSVPQRTIAVLVTGFVLFGFYGAAGLPEGAQYRIEFPLFPYACFYRSSPWHRGFLFKGVPLWRFRQISNVKRARYLSGQVSEKPVCWMFRLIRRYV